MISILFRSPTSLIARARSDLARRHTFAWERIGWISVRPAMAGERLLLLAESYFPVADDHYIEDRTVGAKLGARAITAALNVSQQQKVGMFYVHQHRGVGEPEFSESDLLGHRQIVPNFTRLQPGLPHGALVLSEDAIAGKVWLGSPDRTAPIGEFQSVGLSNQVWNWLTAGAKS